MNLNISSFSPLYKTPTFFIMFHLRGFDTKILIRKFLPNMEEVRKFILSCLVLFAAVSDAKLSDYITVCSAKDSKLNECLINSGQQFIEKLKSGIPEYDLPSIDPMMVPIVDFRKAGMGLTLVIKNSTHSGLGNLKFTKANADPSNYQFEFHTLLPMHTILGTYSVDGQIMMLPIKGEGKTNITMHDVEGIWKIYGQPYMQNGTKYMKIKEFKVSVVPKLMGVTFEDLFNGNKMLGDIMNEVLNSQWKDLYKYVKPALEKSHSDILQEFAGKVFSKIPYEELFLNL